MIIDKLQQLHNYLTSNNYFEDAVRIRDIMDKISEGDSDNANKRLIAMCNPRYLGNLNIKEFDSVYKWWNFLSEIASEVERK